MKQSLQIIILFITTLILGLMLGININQFSATSKKLPTPEYNGELQAYQLLFDKAETLKNNGSCKKGTPDLMTSPLIVPAGDYCLEDQLFTLTSGTARFYKLGSLSKNVIINDGNLINILSGLSWLFTQGNTDETLPMKDRLIKASHSKLSLRCNFVSDVAEYLLSEIGYQTRPIMMYSFTEPGQAGNQSHWLFEVKHNNQWILVDLPGNTLFKNTQNKLLSGYETVQLLKEGTTIHFKPLATDPLFDVSGFSDQDYDYTLFIENIYGTTQQVENWYKRIFQGFFISDKLNHTSLSYTYNKNSKEEESYNFIRSKYSGRAQLKELPKKVFLERFYP